MAMYGACDVYDEKTGKYIGQARWRRPTDEITPEERKRREAEFSRRASKLMQCVEEQKRKRAEMGLPPIESGITSYAVPVEMTPELMDEIDRTLDKGAVK